jgi:hypothetical protein
VRFTLASSLLKVCDHCGVALVRQGTNLESYGKVAEVLKTDSALRLGAEGHYQGAPRFSLVGRFQLDYGQGAWDEWLMGFEGGSSAWLSEAQGHFYFLREVPLPPVPHFGGLKAGMTVDLGPPGVFVVAEVRSARFVSAQGELPMGVKPGSLLHYADLSGHKGEFATLDYGTGSTAEALYVGDEVSLEQMGLQAYVKDKDAAETASAKGMSCPQCGGPIEIRAAGKTERVACPYCGSLLDAAHGLAVLEALSSPPRTPAIPLGSQGRIDGVLWTVVGYMVRSSESDGERFFWEEYLLYDVHHGFRWLVCSDGHWSFLAPIPAGEVETAEATATYKGAVYRHFDTSTPRVDQVQGEFYWAVARGDESWSYDYVRPPRLLSVEREGTEDASEVNYTEGHYMEAAEVWKAFSLKDSPPASSGVGANQESPLGKSLAFASVVAMFSLVALFIAFLAASAGNRVVYTQRLVIPDKAAPASPEAATITEPFDVTGTGNLQITVTSSVSNSWLYVDGALINEDTSSYEGFDLECSYYFGYDSDGSWTEGSQRASAYLGRVPPGKYRLRLAPQWEIGKAPPLSTDVTVRRGVPRTYQFVLACLALLAWPFVLLLRYWSFEASRWSRSDHPMVHLSSD